MLVLLPAAGHSAAPRPAGSVDVLARANIIRIDGAAEGDGAGSTVDGAGDVNGDGRADILVGAYLAQNNGRPYSGSTYIVFGQSSPTSIDLAGHGRSVFSARRA